MALINDDISYTGLVEKYIGSAYDKIAYVSDNLQLILDALAISEGSHTGLSDTDAVDSHPQAAITNLVADLADLVAQDLALITAYDNLVVTMTNHSSDANVHFPDVPVNGTEYVRKDQTWVTPAPHNHDLDYDPLGAGQAAADIVQGNLDTQIATFNAHNHDGQYDALGAAQSVLDSLNALAITVGANTTSLDTHIADVPKHTAVYSGTVLPAPAGYNEGDVFIVTEP